MSQNERIWNYPPIRALADVEYAFRTLELAFSRLQQTLGSDDDYSALWNGSLLFPTRNAVYDKIELVIAAANALVSDAAYGIGWNGVTTIAPSKNAVYDEIEAVLAAAAALVSDTAYAASWNGVTTIAPSKNAVYDKIELLVAALAALPTTADGTYTPTLTNVANLDAVTLGGDFNYVRQGGWARASGIINIDPTASATITQVGISLPIASNLTSIYNLTGRCAALAIQGEAGGVFGDTTNDRANVHLVSATNTNHSIAVDFDYRILP